MPTEEHLNAEVFHENRISYFTGLRYRMTGVLSKLTPSVYDLGRNALRPTQTIIHSVRSGGHGHIFVKRPGQMYINRLKDAAHFYLIGVGFLPVFIAVFIQHTIFGPCELMDYPTEGPPPHCWQFERTPFRQLYVRLVGVSDMEYHERNLSYAERGTIFNRWRRIEKRVKHLQGERWDYKGYYYEPIYTTWIDVVRKRHEQMYWNYEPHGSSTF